MLPASGELPLRTPLAKEAPPPLKSPAIETRVSIYFSLRNEERFNFSCRDIWLPGAFEKNEEHLDDGDNNITE